MAIGTAGGRPGCGAGPPDLELAVGLPAPLPRFALCRRLAFRLRLLVRHVLTRGISIVEPAPVSILAPAQPQPSHAHATTPRRLGE